MLLQELTRLSGVSGNEDSVREFLRRTLAPAAAGFREDPLGSLIVDKGVSLPGPRVMLCAHMDEVGFLITALDQDGTLCCRPLGGIDPRAAASKVVLVGPRRVPGVLRIRDDYARGRIDAGFDSAEEAARVVTPGDFAVFATESELLGDRRCKAKALDDRAGCAVLAAVLQETYAIPVVGVFSVQEETGMRGAAAAVRHVLPDLAIVLEGTVCSDVPGVPASKHATTQGRGPAISIADRTSAFDVALSERLVALAQERGIPCQRRRISGGGNDGGVIHTAGKGVPCATLSVPTRYIHGPVSMVHRDDFDHAVALLTAFLHELEENRHAH